LADENDNPEYFGSDNCELCNVSGCIDTTHNRDDCPVLSDRAEGGGGGVSTGVIVAAVDYSAVVLVVAVGGAGLGIVYFERRKKKVGKESEESVDESIDDPGADSEIPNW
jgi:hypothetical protein